MHRAATVPDAGPWGTLAHMTSSSPPTEPATSASRITLRDMTRADIGPVRPIESAAYADAWPARAFESELANAFARYRVAAETPAPRPSALDEVRDRLPRWLAERLGGPSRRGIVGFMGVWYMVDQLHLVTIAVAPHWQGHGVGQRLLLDCVDIAVEAELKTIVLEVRVTNARARALYDRFGFRRTGTLRGYYRDNDEDADVMLLDLTPEAIARVERVRAEHRARYGPRFVED